MTGQLVRSTGAGHTAPDEPTPIVAAVRGARRGVDAARAEIGGLPKNAGNGFGAHGTARDPIDGAA